MHILTVLSVVFLAIAVLFVGLVVYDRLKLDEQLTPARKTRLRIAAAFCAVAIGLGVLRVILGG